MWNRASGTVTLVTSAVCDTAVIAYHTVGAWMGRGASVVAGLASSAWHNRLIVALAIGAGALGGAVCCYGGPFLAAGWAAVSSTAAIVVARVVGVWDRLWCGVSYAA